MKLSIGANIVKGPWGGGNRFSVDLSEYLKEKGWQVINHLNDNDIDIILMTDPRKDLLSVKYNQIDIAKYLWLKPDTIVVQRINNCDESRNTKNMNKYIIRANKVADYTVFISNYLKNIFISSGLFENKKFSVIRNGANNKLFNNTGRKKWNKNEPLKITTHHWSNNYNKGFDIYKELDEISSNLFNGKTIKFSYIGNIPQNFVFKNTKVIPPLSGKELVNKIKENHIYITGARGEGAGMHHIEAALCGLPILYINNGGIPEYCKDFGIMFNDINDLKECLKKIIANYDKYFENMTKYPYNSDYMCKQYEDLFLKLLSEKNKLNILKRKKKYISIYFKERFIYRPYRNN